MDISNTLRLLSARLIGSLPTRPLGRTGLKTTILGLGGESLIKLKDKEKEAVELVRAAYELGINYFDTASGYYPSEIRVGKGLEGVRNQVILATKTDDRTASGSMKLLEKSLNHLKTDHIDIWQLHHLDKMAEVNKVFAKGGAMEALLSAKEQGMVKYLGITGHTDHRPLCEAMDRYQFDTALLAVNAADRYHESFMPAIQNANKKGMGIIGMKVYGRGLIFEPTKLSSAEEAFNYVLSLPISTAIIGQDSIKQLLENVSIAQNFKPLTDEQMVRIAEKVKDYAKLALFFRKGCEKFNPWW